MPSFSPRSLGRLASCNATLNQVLKGVVAIRDCTILTGHRGKEAQNQAVKDENSQVSWPDGKHNSYPSNAVDAAPYPVRWDCKIVEPEHRQFVRWKAVYNLCRFYYFGGLVVGYAAALGKKVRYGGDWDGDGELDDQKFKDLVHFETKE